MENDDVSFLSLTEEQVDALASGFGDNETVGVLRLGQYSRMLQSLASILDLAPPDDVKQVIHLLEAGQANDESSYIDALSYPHILQWSWVALDSLLRGGAEGERRKHLAYLRGVAASVAHQCGIDFEIEIPLLGNEVLLPGIGRARFLAEVQEDHAVVVGESGELAISVGNASVDVLQGVSEQMVEWQRLRVIESERSGCILRVAVDDLDPYRHYSTQRKIAPADWLDEEAFEALHQAVDNAWAYLTTHHLPHAPSIAAGLRVVVPESDYDVQVWHQSSDAFGALAVPSGAHQHLARVLLEGVQRMKVSALDYLFPLHNSTQEIGEYLVSWQPRPVSFRQYFEALYAMPAVAQYWSEQADSATDAEQRVNAELLHVLWQSRWETGRRQLTESGELTELGRHFVSLIQVPTPEPASAEIESLARLTEMDVRISGRLSNLVPAKVPIEQLAQAWLSFEDVPLTIGTPCRSRAEATLKGWQSRRRLAIRKIVDGEVRLAHQGLLDEPAPTADLDALIVDGHLDLVATSCRHAIVEHEADRETWVRLALACRSQQNFAAFALVRFPEIVMALHGEIVERSRRTPDPIEVAAWVAPLLLSRGEDGFVPARLDEH